MQPNNIPIILNNVNFSFKNNIPITELKSITNN